MITIQKRITIVRTLMGLVAVYGFFGSFAAHWFFPELYFFS